MKRGNLGVVLVIAVLLFAGALWVWKASERAATYAQEVATPSGNLRVAWPVSSPKFLPTPPPVVWLNQSDVHVLGANGKVKGIVDLNSSGQVVVVSLPLSVMSHDAFELSGFESSDVIAIACNEPRALAIAAHGDACYVVQGRAVAVSARMNLGNPRQGDKISLTFGGGQFTIRLA